MHDTFLMNFYRGASDHFRKLLDKINFFFQVDRPKIYINDRQKNFNTANQMYDWFRE